MGKHLLARNIHVYSNYFPLLVYLISEDFDHLVVLGGQYIKSQNVLVSPDRQSSYQGRYLFCSGDGLTEAGLTKSTLLAFMEEEKMAGYVGKVVALIEAEKIGILGGIPLFTLDELDIVVTGKNASPEMLAILENKKPRRTPCVKQTFSASITRLSSPQCNYRQSLAVNRRDNRSDPLSSPAST